jgi:hypothetical protein
MANFEDEVAQHSLNQLAAHYAQVNADYARAKAEGDTETAASCAEAIAELEDKAARLDRLHQRHIASQNPPAPQPLTDGEFMARAPERMDYNDVWRMASKSKYGAPDEASFRAGIAEVQRRRARGE